MENTGGTDEIKLALITASTAYHIDKFLWRDIRALQQRGYTVHIAAGFDVSLSRNSSDAYIRECRDRFLRENIVVHELPFTRFPISLRNFSTFLQLRKLFSMYHFQVAYCHTPTGGLVTRLAAITFRKRGMTVLYMAHGFHFFKGAPIFNWLFYFPVEWLLAFLTDILIVINQEDEDIARKMPFRMVVKTNGVGVPYDLVDKVKPINLAELDIPSNAFVFLCVGELSRRKNQGTLIRCFARVIRECSNAVLLLAGEGENKEEYKQLSESLGLGNSVKFLGWRDDIPSLILAADAVVSAARQEGLPINLVEAMTAGKAIIASGCRGNRELAEQAGIVAENEDEFTQAMIHLYRDSAQRKSFEHTARAASERYSSHTVGKQMDALYNTICQ